MNTTARFRKLAITLFTSDISDEEMEAAKKLVDALEKVSKDFSHWVEKIEENFEKVNDYHGKASAIRSARQYFAKVMDDQKEKFEHIRGDLSKILDDKKQTDNQQDDEHLNIDEIKDLKMMEDISSISQESEKFTEIYNKFYDTMDIFGEKNFLEEYKTMAQKVVEASDSFKEIMDTIADRIKKDILGKQSI